MLVPVYTSNKDESNNSFSHFVNINTGSAYCVDTHNGVAWSDYLDARDDLYLDFMNISADAAKKYLDVPVIYKHVSVHRRYFINKSLKGGFDGLGCEAYGSINTVSNQFACTSALNNQFSRTAWNLITETNNLENVMGKYNSGQWSYESKDDMFTRFNTALDLGMKGIFDFLLADRPDIGGKLGMAYSWIINKHVIGWASEYKKILQDSEFVAELAGRKYKDQVFYYYVSGSSENLLININNLDVAKESDFGYIGRKLKDPWDTDDRVWYSFKNSGFDSIHVGHEHCNSASVVYRGIRLQYGQKSSTYDRANYLQSDGTISSTRTSTPIVGGTTIPVRSDGSLGQGGLFLYDASKDDLEPPGGDIEPPVEAAYTETYDFNGVDFDTSSDNSGVCASDYIVRAISDTSNVPEGFTGGVYGRANKNSNGYATFSAIFANSINTEKLVSLKVRMYVDSYIPISGKTPLVRILPESASSSMVSEVSFEEIGGVYDQWCGVDILPLLNESGLVKDNILTGFIMTYQYYTNDTAVECYFDSLILGYN